MICTSIDSVLPVSSARTVDASRRARSSGTSSFAKYSNDGGSPSGSAVIRRSSVDQRASPVAGVQRKLPTPASASPARNISS